MLGACSPILLLRRAAELLADLFRIFRAVPRAGHTHVPRLEVTCARSRCPGVAEAISVLGIHVCESGILSITARRTRAHACAGSCEPIALARGLCLCSSRFNRHKDCSRGKQGDGDASEHARSTHKNILQNHRRWLAITYGSNLRRHCAVPPSTIPHGKYGNR